MGLGRPYSLGSRGPSTLTGVDTTRRGGSEGWELDLVYDRDVAPVWRHARTAGVLFVSSRSFNRIRGGHARINLIAFNTSMRGVRGAETRLAYDPC